MKTSIKLFATAATLFTVITAAQAGVLARDVPYITNGGTGHPGLTQSAGQPRMQMAYSSVPSAVPGGEASTIVNGQPNVQPKPEGASAAMTTMTTATRVDTRSMGYGAIPSQSTTKNMTWGTPD